MHDLHMFHTCLKFTRIIDSAVTSYQICALGAFVTNGTPCFVVIGK